MARQIGMRDETEKVYSKRKKVIHTAETTPAGSLQYHENKKAIGKGDDQTERRMAFRQFVSKNLQTPQPAAPTRSASDRELLSGLVRQTMPDAYRRTQTPMDAFVQNRLGESLGQYGKGNIDLYNRPQYRQRDGSLSTVNSMSFGDETGKEILVPTIGRDAHGRPVQLTEDQAIDQYYKTGQYLGKFDSIDEADKYADQLHRQQEAYYDDSQLRALANQAPRPFEVGGAVRRFQQTGEMNITPELKKMMDEAPESGQGIRSSTQEEVNAAADWTKQRVENANKAQSDRELRTFDRHNPIIAGALQGTGIPSMLTAGEQALARLTGNEEAQKQSAQMYENELREAQGLQERHPYAFGAGSLAGNIGTMALGGELLGGAAESIKAPKLAVRAITGGILFGGSTAAHQAGSLATGLMSGTEFARNVGVSTVSGAAQSAAAMATAVGLEDLLRRTGSQTLFLDWVKNLSSATAGAGTRIGIEYAMQDKTPTDLFRKNYMAMHPEATEEDLQKAYTDSLRQQAAVQFGTAFAMNLLSATMDTYKTNSRNFSWLKQQYEDLEKDIELAATMRPANSEDLDSWQEAINNRTQALRETLQGNYFGGQQDKVDAMTAALDAIDARAADFVAMQRGTNTFGASAGTGTATGTGTALVPMDLAAAIDQAMKQGVAEAQAQPPAVPGMEQLRALAAPPTETSEAQIPSTDITTGAVTAQRDIPGNPYTRTAMQDIDGAARQIQAAQYERSQYPSVEQLNDELNSPFAVYENESPEITANQSRAGAERLAALADARANQQAQLQEGRRQALINSGVNQDSSYVPTTDRQPLERFVNRLAEQDQTAQRAAQIDRRIAENTAAIEAIRAEARPSAVDSAQMNGYTQNIDTQENLSREAIGYGTGEPESNLSGEGSRWPVSLSAGERNGSIPSAAGVPAESSWRAGKDAADPEAGTLRFTGEVPATQIFPEAEPGQVIHLVSSGTTPSVNKGGAVLKAAGAKKVTYYGSDNDIATIRGEQVRASVNLDTGEVNIRVNDPNTTAEQQSYHEAVEIGVGDGRIVVADAMKHLKSSLMDMGIDAAGADEIITKVSSLYQQGNTTPEGMAHANKEMVCDGGARINQFDGVEGYEDAAAFMQVISDILHPYCNEKLGGAFDAEAEDAPVATMEGVTPEQAKALETVNTVIDTKDGTANALPIQYSADLWNESQYVKERAKAIETICQNLNVSKEQAEKYIDDVNSVAKMIIADRGRYDYKNSGLSPFVSNAEYGGSFDFDTLCPKRGPFIGTFQAIQELLPNTALTRDEVLAIRKMMDDNGLEVPCGKCYVEGSRAAMGEFTKKFLELYKKYYPENWQPNMAQANTPDGIEWIRLTHPECYEQYEYFWNHYGTLKPGDPNLFASQQKPKLYMSHSAYSNEILREFKNKLTVIEKNRNGGIRFQSFSDCEIIHIIDAMQAIMDMSVVGLNGQGYTKQPNFAAAFGDTGLKINLSIDAWGFDEDGKLIFNSKEGMPFETAMELRNKHSKNVGTICCVYDDKMLLAALADDRIDFIIPFHRSQWKKSQYKAMGLPSTTKDYTYQQNEKWLDPSKHTHEYRGRQVKTKCLNYMPNDYWDFFKSGKENAEKYLDMCYRDGKRPKFYKFLDKTMVDGKAKFSLKADGSTDGYWKLLIDFKMYDNDGVGSPQMPVRPNFDMQAIQRMFAEYAGDHHSYPVAKGIVDQFVADYKKKHPGIHYSSKLNLSGKKTTSKKKDSSGNELTVQQEEYFKDSKIRDEDGNLLVVYHGTSEDFTVFDRSKGRSNMDIQGSFFSPWDIDAEGYGPNVKTVYLNIKNPAPEGVAYKALNMFKGQNGAGIKAREYLISRGYDGVNNGDEEYIAFYPEQIKNIDNLAPTENEDIRYSSRLRLDGKVVELTEREEKLMEQLSNSYLERIEQVTAQKDAQIAELKEKMKTAVGAEKEKARQRIEKLRQEKNDRIAYLEKQWRQNTNWRIAELKKKAETKLGKQHDDMIRRLANLQAQKDKKIDEILAAHRAQKQAARDKRNDRKLRVKFQKLAQKALRESRNKPGLASERVQELLKDIDLTALGMTDTTRTSLHNKLLEIMEMRKTDENYLALHAEDDWKKVERLFKKQIKDMSLEEVSDMITELSALSHYQETTDRLLRDEQNRSAAEVGRQIVQDLKELTPLDVTNPVKVMSAKYLRDNLSPERAFNRLSGYKRDSAMKSLYRQVLDGYTRVKTFEKMSSELFERFEKDEKNKDFLKNGAKQTIPITSKYGQTALISPAMRVSLYMASKNRDNQRHIATDGMTVPEPSAYAKGLIEDAYGRGTTIILDPTDINKICADMTESEKEFASLLETFFDGYAKDAINETSVDLDGVLKAIVDNYFPISSDKNFLAKSMDNFQDPTLEGWNNLKKRQEGANNKILLEDARQVLQRHIRNTARYYGLAIPLRNWNKVYGYTSHRDEFTGTRNSVQSAIKNAWNSDTADYIERLIRDDINAGGRKAERGILDSMRSAYAGSTLTLNASVALKQTTSYAMAGSIIDTGSLMYGLAHRFTKADEQYMDSITPWGWARRQGQSTIELGEMAKKQDPITKNTPNLNQAMDVWTTNRLFLATEENVRKEFPDLHRGDKKYDETLAERYNQVLWRTQPQYEAAFRPEYLRKTDIGSRTFGMFKTESMQMSGELIDAWGQWKADEKRAKNGSETAAKYSEESAKNFYKTLASWTASNLTFALMGTALNILLFHKGKPYRNEKGEIDFETLLKKTGLNFLSSAAGGFFGASSMVDFATYIYSALKGEKSQWYDIEAPGLSLINDLINNMGNMIGTMGNEEASTGAKAQTIAKFALSVSKFTPIGFAENIVNLANSVVLYNQDLREGTMGRWEAGKGLLKDTSPTRDQYANMAVDAARKGDMEKAARALKKTKKANLEKAVGRPITENMYKRINEDPNNLRSYLGVALDAKAPSISSVPDHGYSSFTKLREDLGDPERTQNWHHIVEQEQMEKNLSGFTSTQVNNTNNIVSIPSGSKSPHAKISEYYGSVQDFTGGKTVREWLKGKSFEEQWEFGMKQLREYGDLVPTDSGWVFVPDKEKIESKIPMNEGKSKEKTDTQRTWESRIAEAREDGGVTRHEAGAVALEMLANGVTTDEIKELYKKTDKKVGQWKDGTFEDYLKGRDAVDAARSIQDKDKKQQTEKRKKYMDDYLGKYKGSYDDELLLWKLAGFSENTFNYH